MRGISQRALTAVAASPRPSNLLRAGAARLISAMLVPLAIVALHAAPLRAQA